MSAAAATTVTSADRLGMTLALSLIAHAIVVLGVTFTADLPEDLTSLAKLDVILVQRRSTEAPETADFLAQANQVGGGNSEEVQRPQSPVSGPLPLEDIGIAPMVIEATTPAPQEPTPTEILTQAESNRIARIEPMRPDVEEKPLPTALELIERRLEMARLEAEIGRRTDAYAKRPRRKFISANTKEYQFASYMQAWVAKVERVGNLNYPDEARREKLHGNLVMTVAVARDGSIQDVKIVQPSGHRVLDDAAVRIVKLAAPYADFPPEITAEVDVLHITRTWQFLPGNRLAHR